MSEQTEEKNTNPPMISPPSASRGKSSEGDGLRFAQAVRSWARANGRQVEARGKVSKDLITSYLGAVFRRPGRVSPPGDQIPATTPELRLKQRSQLLVELYGLHAWLDDLESQHAVWLAGLSTLGVSGKGMRFRLQSRLEEVSLIHNDIEDYIREVGKADPELGRMIRRELRDSTDDCLRELADLLRPDAAEGVVNSTASRARLTGS